MIRRILTSDGSLLAVADEAGTVSMWRLPPPSRWADSQLGRHRSWVNHVAVVEQPGRPPVLASASDDQQVILWPLPDAARPLRITVGSEVHGVAAAADGLVTTDQAGNVRSWRATDAGVVAGWQASPDIGPLRALTSFVERNRWRIFAGGSGGRCVLLDASSGKRLRKFEMAPPAQQRSRYALRRPDSWPTDL